MGSGRSGTYYLADLWRRNIGLSVAAHEPYPFLNGAVIKWHEEGLDNMVERCFVEKLNIIQSFARMGYEFYLETNHSFLKSFCHAAIKAIPDLWLIHLVRNPLEVAKSHLNRQFRFVSSCPYFIQKGSECFKGFDFELTDYQLFILQWIELEHRAIAFKKRYHLDDKTFFMRTPSGFQHSEIIDMVEFFGAEFLSIPIRWGDGKNENKEKTIVEDQDIEQFNQLIESMDQQRLEIFKLPPYSSCKPFSQADLIWERKLWN